VFITELGVMSVIIYSKHSVQHQSTYTLYILLIVLRMNFYLMLIH